MPGQVDIADHTSGSSGSFIPLSYFYVWVHHLHRVIFQSIKSGEVK